MLGQSKNTPRCGECPDRLDYILKLGGQNPHYRKDNPDKLGFKKLGASSSTTTYIPTQKNSCSNNVKETDESITRTCKECGKKFPNSEIDKYFQRNHRSKDGYLKTCKKCMGQKLVKGQKKAKEKRQAIKPSNEAPPKPEPVSQPEKIVAVKTCEKCLTVYTGDDIKENFSYHRLSPDKLYRKCKTCMAQQKSEIMQEKYAQSEITKNIIKIDFTDNPEMLKSIQQMARRDFRNIDQEILAIIDAFMETTKLDRI